jgi:hypothetical protein
MSSNHVSTLPLRPGRNSPAKNSRPPMPFLLPSPKHSLDLPAEIRDIIYKFALRYDDGLMGEAYPSFCVYRKRSLLKMATNLLKLVCRQTRHETKGILLQVHDTFTFKTDVIRDMLYHMSRHPLAAATWPRLVLTTDGSAPLYGFRTIGRFIDVLRAPVGRNLKRVNISLEIITTKDKTKIRDQLLDLFVQPKFAYLESYCQQNSGIRVHILCHHCPGSVAKKRESHRSLAAVMRQLRGNYLRGPQVFLMDHILALPIRHEHIADYNTHFAAFLPVKIFWD